MLDDLFGETGGAIAQFILALFVVLILILIVAWLLKKLGGGRFGASNSGQAELAIIDTLAIDPKRRLVLVRHGKLEHLLLIGGGSDEVVERSIIGGLPISARVQANKPQTPAPEKAPEPLARPSSKFLDRLERTNAARKSSVAKSEADKPPTAGPVASEDAVGDNNAPSGDGASSGAGAAIAGTAAASTVAAGSAYAAMIASTSKAESESAADASASKPDDIAASRTFSDTKNDRKANPTPVAVPPPVPAAPTPEPAPIDLPPLLNLPKSSGTPLAPVGRPVPSADKPSPKSEREAIEQSLNTALHDSLLAPEPAKAPETASTIVTSQTTTLPEPPPTITEAPALSPGDPESGSVDDMDFNLFDDGELEREMEAALADTSPAPAPSPELDSQSTAAIEAELAINLEEPEPPVTGLKMPSDMASDAPEAPSKPEAVSASEPDASSQTTSDAAQTKEADDLLASAVTEDKDGPEDMQVPQDDLAPAPKDTLPPLKDIPVELSRPDPVAVQIPSRGPAANATSVTKADNGVGSELTGAMPEGPSSPVNLSQLLKTPDTGEQPAPDSETKPASGKSSDLDEEMRRLLGEIAGDPKAN